MIEKLQQNNRCATIILAFSGIAVMAGYSLCAETCTFLHGSLFGMDLKYLRMSYMVLILITGALDKDTVCAVLLSMGAGGEVFLLCFQVVNGVYCPYCLAFAGVVFLLFMIHVRQIRLSASILFAATGFFVFFFLSASAMPAYADEIRVTSFGESQRRRPQTPRILVEYLPSGRGLDSDRQLSESHEHNKHYYADFSEDLSEPIFSFIGVENIRPRVLSLIHGKEVHL